jgi:hypothetical protein
LVAEVGVEAEEVSAEVELASESQANYLVF